MALSSEGGGLLVKRAAAADDSSLLSLSLSLHLNQRSNAYYSSASDNSCIVSSSDPKCSGYSDDCCINLDLSMSICGSQIEILYNLLYHFLPSFSAMAFFCWYLWMDGELMRKLPQFTNFSCRVLECLTVLWKYEPRILSTIMDHWRLYKTWTKG